MRTALAGAAVVTALTCLGCPGRGGRDTGAVYTERTAQPSTGSAPAPSPAPAPGAQGSAPRARCVVARVVDGDTFNCAGGLRIRLLLVDAPERDQRPFGAAAQGALARLLPVGSAVGLESDVRPTDRYGRTLAYVYTADGRMANEEMARGGYVVVLSYPPNVRYVERIRAAVAEAQRSKRGLWKVSGFACAPADHRRGRC